MACRTASHHVLICDADSDKPESPKPYTRAYVVASNRLYVANGSGVWKSGEAFPVGSVFFTANPVDPATLLGYGTWQQIDPVLSATPWKRIA